MIKFGLHENAFDNVVTTHVIQEEKEDRAAQTDQVLVDQEDYREFMEFKEFKKQQLTNFFLSGLNDDSVATTLSL